MKKSHQERLRVNWLLSSYSLKLTAVFKTKMIRDISENGKCSCTKAVNKLANLPKSTFFWNSENNQKIAVSREHLIKTAESQ